jgi:hypothetical protein
MKVKIQPGTGYWDVTQYPIGGCFKRVDRAGPALDVDHVEILDRPAHGCNRLGVTSDGRKIAFDSRYEVPA